MGAPAAAPAVYASAPAVAPAVYGAGYPFTYGKREAEAEPYLGYAGLGYTGYAGLGYAAPAVAPAVYAAAPAVAPAVYAAHSVVAPAVLGNEESPNPVHSIAATPFGLVHSSLVGVCTNVKGEQVDC